MNNDTRITLQRMRRLEWAGWVKARKEPGDLMAFIGTIIMFLAFVVLIEVLK